MPRTIDPRYVQQQLKRDPRLAAAHIIRDRNQQLGLVDRKRGQHSAQLVHPPGAAENARAAIDNIREQFWDLPLDELQAQLAAIDLGPYPALVNVVEQLKQAAEVRPAFAQLAQRLSADLTLFNCVKQSVTMAPRDLAGMKEAIMRALLRGESIKMYQSSARIIKTEFPQIYAIRPEWFDEILNAKRLRYDVPRPNSEFRFGAPIWVYVLLIMLLTRGCASLFR